MARPKVLDDSKRREVCALATAGMSWPRIARYVGCSERTLRRERSGNEEFDQRVRRAEMACSLAPLEALRRASATHWRAAAWMIEREDRRDARSQAEQKRSDERRADKKLREALAAVREIVAHEVDCPLTRARVEHQLHQRLGPLVGEETPPPTSLSEEEIFASVDFLQRMYEDRGSHTDADVAEENVGVPGAIPTGKPTSLRAGSEAEGGPDEAGKSVGGDVETLAAGASAQAERPRHPNQHPRSNEGGFVRCDLGSQKRTKPLRYFVPDDSDDPGLIGPSVFRRPPVGWGFDRGDRVGDFGANTERDRSEAVATNPPAGREFTGDSDTR